MQPRCGHLRRQRYSPHGGSPLLLPRLPLEQSCVQAGGAVPKPHHFVEDSHHVYSLSGGKDSITLHELDATIAPLWSRTNIAIFFVSESCGKVYSRKESSDLIEIKADLKVGKRIINETYTSLVIYYKEKDKILVTNIDGPLNRLKNEWNFKEINNSTQLEFEIDFELKNNILNTIMKKYFNFGLNKIADAFEKRALELYK